MSAQGDSTSQMARGFMEIALCLAEGMQEADPQAVERINYAAGKAFNRLMAQGDKEAAELIYRFGRLLLEQSRFPRDALNVKEQANAGEPEN